MSRLKLNYFIYELKFRYPFSIAAGTRTGTPAVFTELSFENYTGYGESALPPYLKDTVESTVQFFKSIDSHIFSDPIKINEILDYTDHLTKGDYPAKAAIDMALHDLVGKMTGQPVHQLLGLLKNPMPLNTYTIGLDNEEMIQKKIEETKNFKLLKVKLNGENDEKIILLIRKLTDKAICVDINQGWNDLEQASDRLHFFKTQNIIFIEQPFQKNEIEKSARLKEKNILPLIADESFQSISDFEKIKNSFDGVNVKLMKCGGIRAGRKIIELAKKNNKSVLLGCMSESSCGVAAAAQLGSLVNWTDLDGPLLINNDPFTGVTYLNGKISLSGKPGLGINKVI